MPPDSPMGFFGKLPARGDFLRVGLPRSFTDPLDDWLRRALSASRAHFGDDYAGPPWRFALPAGGCGPSPAIGLMIPSRDRIGRAFPLVFARLAPADDPLAAAFLAAAEQAGLSAITEVMEPEDVRAMLRLPAEPSPVMPDSAPTQCWTALPTPAEFVAMLEAASATP